MMDNKWKKSGPLKIVHIYIKIIFLFFNHNICSETVLLITQNICLNCFVRNKLQIVDQKLCLSRSRSFVKTFLPGFRFKPWISRPSYQC